MIMMSIIFVFIRVFVNFELASRISLNIDYE